MTNGVMVPREQGADRFEHLALFQRIDVTAFDKQGFDAEKKSDVLNAKPRIRCPHCKWQPEKTSRWFCAPMGAPEFFKGGCGTRWNTFDTSGKCPGCNYVWKHTSCLACEKTALHEDWYEKKEKE
jgi:hypothetical protein